ncbi:phosphatidylinositol N-acetylglucosaminyltransferase subunit gpi1 [Borealophlyctis nickersoniae]|nr:phosphatidylinositol N-acetylglucosaminyltransferase subunit gpi1 [Borealophlyctis nickersoniae]
MFAFRVITTAILAILNIRFGRDVPLKHYSAAAQQVDLRLQQVCFWPGQYTAWRRTTEKLSPVAQAQYIGFYNTLWLIANDIIIGVALGAFLMENCHAIATILESNLTYLTIDSLRSTVVWLMGWPAGLKLNSGLTTFLGELFLWLIHVWSGITSYILPALPTFIYYIGLTGTFLGSGMIVALTSDLLSLVTFHLFVFYAVASKIYYWQVTVILSLFSLFRGKKRNVLRNRTDSAEYDLDQLLLGTILFTLLVFLFPTVAVYYILCSLNRVTVVAIQGTAEISLAFVNHFPLFALMLRFKDGKRLPAGIRFDICKPDAIAPRRWWRPWHRPPATRKQSGDTLKSSPNPPPRATRRTKNARKKETSGTLTALDWDARPPGTTYLYIKSVPMDFTSLFYQYQYLFSRVWTHHMSSKVIASLFTGETIERLPRLQYPTLPEMYGSFADLESLWRGAGAWFGREGAPINKDA